MVFAIRRTAHFRKKSRAMPATPLTSESDFDSEFDLAVIVANYANSADLPKAEWLTRRDLKRPQTNFHSIELWTRRAKRTMHMFCTVVMVVLLAPVMLLVAMATGLTSHGLIMFQQIRTGLNLRTS